VSVVTGETVSLPAFLTGTGTAQCPATSVLVSGGFTSNNTTAVSFDVYDDYPSTIGAGGVWTVEIGSSSEFKFTPYALCSP